MSKNLKDLFKDGGNSRRIETRYKTGRTYVAFCADWTLITTDCRKCKDSHRCNVVGKAKNLKLKEQVKFS